MDPLSIITLAAGTTHAVYSLSMTLYAFMNSVKKIDSDVEALAAEVTGCRRVLDAIGVALNSPVIRSKDATAEDKEPVWAALAGSLNDCRKTVERFSMELDQALPKQANQKSFLVQSMKFMKLSYHMEDIGKIRAQMGVHSTNLQISLHLVSIMVTTLSPGVSGSTGLEEMSEEVAQLRKNLDQLQHQSSEDPEIKEEQQLLKRTARMILSDIEGTVSGRFDDGEKKATSQKLQSVLKDFNQSFFSNALELATEDKFDELEDASEEIELAITRQLFTTGESLTKEAKYQEAESCLSRAFHHLHNLISPLEDIDIDHYHLLLVKCYLGLNKFTQAELILKLFLQDTTRKTDIKTVSAYYMLAKTYLCQYNFNDAHENCRRVLSILKRLRGTEGQTQVATRMLALIYEANGDNVASQFYLANVTSQQIPAEDIPCFQRFKGYERADRLRTTLREKQAAIESMINNKLIKNATVDSFNPGVDLVELSDILLWAVREGDGDVVKWTLSRGVDPNTCTREETPVVLIAADCNHAEILNDLLASGADVNATDRSGRSSLIWAALKGYVSPAKVLIQHGIDVNKADNDGATPLADAAYKGHSTIAELLMKNGADASIKSKNGHYPLSHAADMNNYQVVKVLVDHKVDVNVHGQYGKTPLIIAAEGRNYQMVQTLLKAGAEVEAMDDQGRTALIACLYSRSHDMVYVLLEYGAEINKMTEKNGTALHNAASSDVPEMVQILLDNGADPTIQFDGKTPLQVAEESHSRECIRILKKSGLTESSS